MLKNLFLVAILVMLPFSLFSAGRIISPASGEWSNKQSLVVDLNDGAECFYSFSENPLTSGFVYDEPVFIEKTGDVHLYIAVVVQDEIENYDIQYSVREPSAEYSETSLEGAFIASLDKASVIRCSASNPVQIPESFQYGIGDGELLMSKGTELSVSQKSMLSRYVPCIVTDGSSSWRFVMELIANESGSFSTFSVPFEFSDWTSVSFVDNGIIWSVDNGEWSDSKDVFELDRSKSHILSWRSSSVDEAPMMQSFVLPPKPELDLSYEDGSLVFSVKGDSRYQLEQVSSGTDGEILTTSGQFNSIVFDTVEGDSVFATATFAVYCDGVYQGELSSEYLLDKRPPFAPTFVPSQAGEFVRKPVLLDITTNETADIFYSFVDNGSYDVNKLDFKKFDGKGLFLEADGGKSTFFKIVAYAIDVCGNKSGISEYSVTIDEYNYFISEEKGDPIADGSEIHPFSSFEQAESAVNSSKISRLHIEGVVHLPPREILLTAGCTLYGDEGSCLVLPDGCFIKVQDAKIVMKGIVFQNEVSESATSSCDKFFVLDNGILSMENCELFAAFSDNGTLLSLTNSVADLRKSGLTVKGCNYASLVSSVDSRFSAADCNFSVVADTGISFSFQGGMFELKESSCKVSAKLGRIAEFSDVNVRMRENLFEGELSKKIRGVEPVWFDNDSLVVENFANKIKGF